MLVYELSTEGSCQDCTWREAEGSSQQLQRGLSVVYHALQQQTTVGIGSPHECLLGVSMPRGQRAHPWRLRLSVHSTKELPRAQKQLRGVHAKGKPKHQPTHTPAPAKREGAKAW